MAPSDQSIESAQLPEICVLGDESSGKSCVLRRLLQLAIFQTGQDIITRFPLRVKLIYTKTQQTPKMIFKVSGNLDVESLDEKQIHDAIKAAHDVIEKTGKAISDVEATLEVYSDRVPNIDIIDLPGTLSQANPGEPVDLPTTVKTIVTKYISKPCVVLFIVDGKANQRNSPASGLLKEIKPKNVIKVFTKVDCLYDARQTNPLESFMQIFNREENNVVEL